MKQIFFILVVLSGLALSAQNGGDINQLDSAGKKQGYWIIKNAGGKFPGYNEGQKIEEGSFKNSWKEGLWKSYFPNGQLKSEIHYVMGRPKGNYKLYYENGKIEEEGNWERTKNTGSFKRYYPNGNLMQDFSFTEAGLRTGKQTYYYANGNLRLEGNWKNGKESGQIIEYYENGEISSKKEFANGELNKSSIEIFAPKGGSAKQDQDGGERMVVKAESGEQPNQGGFSGTGNKTLYNHNKQIAKEGYFKDFRLMDGRYYRYDENGILIQIMIFKDGRYIGNGMLSDADQ